MKGWMSELLGSEGEVREAFLLEGASEVTSPSEEMRKGTEKYSSSCKTISCKAWIRGQGKLTAAQLHSALAR